MKKKYKTILKLLAIVPLLLMTNASFSQNRKQIYHHAIFWSKTEFNHIFNNKFGLGADVVLRSKSELNSANMFKAPNRESFRLWVHYQFSENARLSISPFGIMHTTEYVGKPSDYDRPDYLEWRSTIQFYHHLKQWKGRIMHTWRYRYEFRWQEQPLTDTYRFFMRARFRYRIRIMLNNKAFYDNYVVYASISNEIGLNLGRNVVWNTFNQNRFYAGVGVRVLNAMRFELRYVDRFRTRGGTGYEFDNGHGFMIGIYIDQLGDLGKKDVLRVRYWD